VVRILFLMSAAPALTLGSAALAQPAPAASAPKPVARDAFVKNIDTRFAAIDTNHDGVLSKAELQAAQARLMQQLSVIRQQRITAQFKRLDTNHDGQLNLQEFAAGAPTLKSNETPDQLVQQLDTNHDGKISPDEFRAPQLARFNTLDLNHDGVLTPEEERRALGGQNQPVIVPRK